MRKSLPIRRAETKAVAIFARAPEPGQAKTRLAPLLGARGAAEFQRALIADSVRKVSALKLKISPYLFLAGRRASCSLPGSFTFGRQRGRDLGVRLERAFRQLLQWHRAAVVIGTDAPLVPLRAFHQALSELKSADAVLGPSPDGGFYLLGLRRLTRGLFRGARCGTRFAYADMVRRLLRESYVCSILPPVADVDRPQDLTRLERELGKSRSARRLAPASWHFLISWRRMRPAQGRGRVIARRARSTHLPGPRRQHRRPQPGRG